MKKKIILTAIISGILFASLGAYAATTLASSTVSYDNSKSGGKYTNVQNALDELYDLSVNKLKDSYMASEVSITNSYNKDAKTLQDAIDGLYERLKS